MASPNNRLKEAIHRQTVTGQTSKAVAQEIWKRLGGEKSPISVKSLEVKLSELVRNPGNKSRTAWWTNPQGQEAFRLLQEITGLTREEIMASDDQRIEFPEFPKLPSLTAEDCEPCRIWRRHSLNVPEPTLSLFDIVTEHLRTGKGLLWIYGKAGAGFRMVRETLNLLASRKTDAGTVRILESEMDADDAEINSLRSASAPSVVLAPFRDPNPQEAKSTLGCIQVVLDDGWKNRLTDWIGQRLRKAARPGPWSEAHESFVKEMATNRWAPFIKTPGDLLSLAAVISTKKEDEDPADSDWKDLPPGLCLDCLADDWLKKVISLEKGLADSFKKVIATAFKDKECAWGRLSREDWEARFEKLDAENGKTTFNELLKRRLFRPDGEGLSPYPHWITAGILLADPKQGGIEFEDLREWAWMPIDVFRSALIRNVLRESIQLGSKKLSRIVHVIYPKGVFVGDFHSAIALESIVWHVGTNSENISPDCVEKIPWNAFFECVRKTGWTSGKDTYPIRFPLTFARYYKDPQEEVLPKASLSDRAMVHDLWQVGWNISSAFKTKKPVNLEIPEEYRWAFPFWADGKLSLAQLTVPAESWPDSKEFWEAAFELVKCGKIDVESIADVNPKSLPAILAAAVLSSPNALTFWESHPDAFAWVFFGIGKDDFEGESIHKPELEKLLSDRIDKEWSEGAKKRFSLLCWKTLLEQTEPDEPARRVVGKIRGIVGHHVPEMQKLVFEHLDEATVLETMRSEGLRPREESLQLLGTLPPKLQTALIVEWIRTGDGTNAAITATDLAPFLTEECTKKASSGIESLIDGLKKRPLEPFARRIWQVTPDRAYQEAQNWLHDPALRNNGFWFVNAPDFKIADLAEMLRQEGEKSSLPNWVSHWCRKTISHCAKAAPLIFSLLLKCEDEVGKKNSASTPEPESSTPPVH